MVKNIPSDQERTPRRDRSKPKDTRRTRFHDDWDESDSGKGGKRSKLPKRAKRFEPKDCVFEEIIEDTDNILDDLLDEEDFES